MKKVFKREFVILYRHQALVEDLTLSPEEVRQNYKKLFNAYQLLLQDATKITAIGDLNQKKLFEAFEALEKQENELKIAAAAFESQEGILITDANNIILRVNQAFSKITGYSSEEAIGKTPNFFRSWQHGANFYAQMRDCIQLTDHWEGEVWKQRKNGEEFPTWVTITAVRDSKSKEISHYVEMFVDITERKLIEQARQEAEIQASRANQAKREFLANMSHEIRTPMNAIVGMTQLVQRTHLSDKQKNYLNKIETSAQSLLHIIDDILDFSKIEAGKLVLEQSRFLLDDIFTNLLSVVELKAQQKGIELLISANLNKQYYFIGDSVRLTQILINLVSNAIKFTEHGKVIVTASAESLDADSTQLYFSVQDSGIGMSEEQTANLFKAFSQADTSTTRKYGGTGLGLSISKALVEMMDGQIWVESELNKGSTFSFIVTLKTAAPVNGTVHSAPQVLATLQQMTSLLVGKKVLLAEDNKINQELIIELLHDVNMIVAVAENGQTAVERVFNEPFDLVLMDVQMPVMDGLTATQLIRQNPRFNQLPIIAMTANATADDKENGLAVGMNDYLTKPIMPEKLIAVLSQWLAWVTLSKPEAALPEKNATNTEIPFDLPFFNIPRALTRVSNNKRLLKKLLLMFVKEYEAIIPKLKLLLVEQHYAEMKRILHTLKSVSGNLEITELIPVVVALEQAVIENNQTEIDPLLETMDTTLAAVLDTIKSLNLSLD